MIYCDMSIGSRDEKIKRTVEWLRNRPLLQINLKDNFVITKSKNTGYEKTNSLIKKNTNKHKCTDCGKEIDRDGRCLDCYKKARKKYAEINAMRDKKKHNNCIECNKPIEKPGRCIDCYNKYRKTQLKDGFTFCTCGKEISKSSRLCWSCREDRRKLHDA
jgi:hypothetical protein